MAFRICGVIFAFTLCLKVPIDELVCQASYDLGVYYFHQKDYEKAGFHLQSCSGLFSQVRSVFTPILSTDKASIDGEEGGKTPAAQQCGLENRSTKVLGQANCSLSV